METSTNRNPPAIQSVRTGQLGNPRLVTTAESRDLVEKHLRHRLDGGSVFAAARCLAHVLQKSGHGIDARIECFPALDLGDGVKRHPAGLRQFFHLGPCARVQVAQQGFKNVCHVR